MASDGGWRRYVVTTGTFLWSTVKFLWPALTPAVILAAIIASVDGAIAWVQKPHVYIPALVFGYFFLLFSLVRRRRVQQVTDYEYGITGEGNWTAILASIPGKKPGDPLQDGLILVATFRSCCTAPIRLKLEEFKVVLDERTHIDQPEVREVVVPRFATKGVKSAFVPRDPKQMHLSGSVTIKLLYGPLNSKATRRYTLKCGVDINLGLQITVLLGFTDESDKAYVEGS